MAEADCEPCLFGWQALDAKARSVVICEGEIDYMIYTQLGINSLSVPFVDGKPFYDVLVKECYLAEGQAEKAFEAIIKN